VVITQAAEQRPERIKTLVYLCAFLPRNGESLSQLAQADAGSLVLPNLVAADDGASVTVRAEAVRSAFYADCSDEQVALARSRLVPQATAPFATPVLTTEERFGRVPRVYIEALRDCAIPLEHHRNRAVVVPDRRDHEHEPLAVLLGAGRPRVGVGRGLSGRYGIAGRADLLVTEPQQHPQGRAVRCAL